jgi:hypothetical protein
MANAAPKFYLPPTGRMGHNTPAIQMLPSPSASRWQRASEKLRKLSEQSKLSGKTFTVSRQQQQERIKAGDLVVWDPTGKPGLWLVTDINPDDGFDYAAIERSIAANQNPCGEIALSEGAKTVLRQKYVRHHEVSRGSLRLEWEGGWGGWANDRKPVIVKIHTVQLANEMEALGIAAL